MKVVATETARFGREEKGESKGAEVGALGAEELEGRQAREGARVPVLHQPGPGRRGWKAGGDPHSADCRVGQCTGGQAAVPINASHPSQV